MNKPITLLAFDPSLHATGWALFYHGNYEQSGVVKIPRKFKGTDAIYRMWDMWQRQHGRTYRTSVVVGEIQEYRHANERASVNSLLLLNGVCFGFLAMVVAHEKTRIYPATMERNHAKENP